MELTNIIKNLGIDMTAETALPVPSTDDLDLTTLPERLDDAMLARVKAIAEAPLPTLPPCDDRRFNQCLRVLLAVLPKRTSDELSGELFVAAYQRQLGHMPAAQISFLADKATERCRWFPTIAECLEIASEWRRWDDDTKRKAEAGRLLRAEERARWSDERQWHREHQGLYSISQEDVDEMSEPMIRIGLKCGALERGEDGKVRPWGAERRSKGEVIF